MSIDEKCKPRFKGIENFLRRVAFNLGNTPSQTEVKIISCIPIDVSDLQHKIIQLEREADDLKNRQGHTVGVHTALCAPHLVPSAAHHPAPCTAHHSVSSPAHQSAPCPALRHDFLSGHSSSRANKQAISFLRPSLEECPGSPPCNTCLSPPQINAECDPCINAQNTCDVEHRPGFFKFQKSKRALKRKDKVNTQLVYYAQTSSASPFKRYKTAEIPEKAPKDSMDRPYLAEMLRKQYRPDKMVVDMSDTSQFSSPVCRDVQHSEYSPCPYEADMCSCCRGRFEDVDPPRHAHTVFQTNPTTTNANNMYYDTSLYDMVPVRERPTKQKNDDECPKKEHKMSSNYAEKVRVKSRFQPYVVNYHNAAPVRMNHKLARRKLPVKSYGKNDKRIASKRQLIPPTSTATSNSCSVNCGQVYSKAPHAKSVIQRVTKPAAKAVLHKNAECLTISLHNTECQTASSKSVQLEPILPDEDKTEITLNQIKTILQSVLKEVKTSSQLKNVADDKPKKDAVVQKGPSQDDIQACSSLLNSYSYSTPYNMNPYAASCSNQMNTSQPLFYPGSPYTMKCLQNYPLFIQTTGRQCSCCYRNIPKVAKSAYTKHAITTATNTESTAVQEHRNKETEKLIKEIYKSLAINMDFPAKDTSSSDYGNLRSTENSKKFEQGTPRPQRMDRADDCVVKKMHDMWTTPIYTNTMFESNIISNAASTPSSPVSKTTTENRTKVKRMEGYVESQSRQSSYSPRVRGGARQGTESEAGRSGGPRVRGGARQGAESEAGRSSGPRVRGGARYSAEYSSAGRSQRAPYVLELPNATTSLSNDSSSNETDSDDTVVPPDQPKKKERTNIFRKVAKLFKSRPKKKDIEPDSDSEHDSEASDSDDYQTIDTRSEKRPKQGIYIDKRRPKIKPHSKLSYSKYYMNRDRNEKRRSPYMEQEYRRYFDEKLMFHHGVGTHKYSSDLPPSNQSVQPQRTYPTYWQNYEARSVHVDPRRNLTSTEQDVAVESANTIQPKATASNKGLAWLKKHKLGIHCGEQWKKLVLEG